MGGRTNRQTERQNALSIPFGGTVGEIGAVRMSGACIWTVEVKRCSERRGRKRRKKSKSEKLKERRRVEGAEEVTERTVEQKRSTNMLVSHCM